jgi:hypothetical protein
VEGEEQSVEQTDFGFDAKLNLKIKINDAFLYIFLEVMHVRYGWASFGL